MRRSSTPPPPPSPKTHCHNLHLPFLFIRLHPLFAMIKYTPVVFHTTVASIHSPELSFPILSPLKVKRFSIHWIFIYSTFSLLSLPWIMFIASGDRMVPTILQKNIKNLPLYLPLNPQTLFQVCLAQSSGGQLWAVRTRRSLRRVILPPLLKPLDGSPLSQICNINRFSQAPFDSAQVRIHHSGCFNHRHLDKTSRSGE